MTFRSDFVNDPAGFMANNVVRCQAFDGSFRISESRPYVMTIKQMNGNPKVVNKTNGRVYHLSADCSGVGRNEKTLVYFVGYKDNDTVSGTLDRRSAVMFTANMDGCTLGIGSQPGDGTCTVTHANMKTSSKRPGLTQSQAQIHQLHGVYDEDFSFIGPDAYMKEGRRTFTTNYGVRTGTSWNFYTQTYEKLSSSVAGNYIIWQTGAANLGLAQT